MGHGARGLQRQRDGVGVPAARSRPLARVSLGRGRPGRLLATSSSGCASALALWNGRDPILKERIFGLTGNQGNHGEDAKEYWWYLDADAEPRVEPLALPLSAARVPVRAAVEENAARGKHDPEFELLDTGAFDDDRYWIVEADYAKADPHDLLLTVRVTNAGPEADDAPRAADRWYRNTWAWEVDGRQAAAARRRTALIGTEHPFLGPLELAADAGPDGRTPDAALLRQRDERRAAVRRPRPRVPEGRHQRPRRLRRATR